MNEKEKELNEVLEELAKNLDITDTEDAAIRESYNAVGEFLAKEGTLLDKYEVEIFPQGSFNLGTIIRPVKEGDDLDIDLVCELKSKEPNWTQYDVKQQVGNRLKESKRYKNLLDEEGRRCWTLLYRDDAPTTTQKYHMDILPSIVDKNYKTIGNNKVGVPDAFFKVILRVNKNSQALGFIYPNDGTHHKMDFYVVTVDDVESLTGIDFFYNLSDETENKVESSSNLSLW